MTEISPHVVIDKGLGNAAYLLDLGDGSALAVDVSRDLRAVDAAARDAGLRIRFAADTHLHADFVTGATELARRAGAEVLAAAAGDREYPHHGLRDGDEVDLGGLTLRALATPGHTDEHVAFELLDGPRTVGVFTGGSLIVGSAARTDLVHPDRTEELARAQFRSLRRLAALDDHVAVWPTHGAGSFCSAPSGSDRTSSIGLERARNPLLAAPDEDTFAQQLLDSLGPYPRYFRELAEVNRRGPEPLDPAPVAHLGPRQLEEARGRGVTVVDVRPVAEFSRAHVPGSVSIPLRPAFATWLGWLVDLDHPLVVVLGPDQDLADVWWQAAKIGQDRIVGHVPDGLESWMSERRPTRSIPLVGPREVAGRSVLDVRERSEFRSGRLPGARNLPLGNVAEHLGSVAGPTVVMCGHAERAMGAASLLAREGHSELAVLLGGPGDWAAATGQALEGAS